MSRRLIDCKDTALIRKFWSLVDKNGPIVPFKELLGNCWLWMGGANGNGYGYFQLYGRPVSATHIAWELGHPYKKFPPFKDAAHMCDVPRCVRPSHIEPMTHRDNILMSILEERHRQRLSPEEVGEIRALAATTTANELAAMFNVADSTIYRILTGRCWAGVNVQQ